MSFFKLQSLNNKDIKLRFSPKRKIRKVPTKPRGSDQHYRKEKYWCPYYDDEIEYFLATNRKKKCDLCGEDLHNKAHKEIKEFYDK